MSPLSEKKTEKLIRDQLFALGYTEDAGVLVEEQRSDNLEINKLLKGASKTGKGGKGAPEFIITSTVHPDLIVVVECKASISKHQSEAIDHPVEYAVDGAIHYAKHLSKRYNVIAIAASGQTKKELMVSAFLVSKGSSEAKPLLDSSNQPVERLEELQTLHDYASRDPEVEKRRVSDLMGFARELHNFMRDYPRWSASLWDLAARALALGLSPDPDNPSEAVPEVTEGAPKRFAFAREICAQIDHLPAAGVRRRNLGSVEITQVDSSRGTYVARFDEHTMPRQVTAPFEFKPAYLRTPELLLHACLMRLTGTREMPPRPALCVPEPIEKDGLRYVQIHDLVEPARTGFTEWLHRFSEPPKEHEGALIAPEVMYGQFLKEAV